jgi:hypothetical protein
MSVFLYCIIFRRIVSGLEILVSGGVRNHTEPEVKTKLRGFSQQANNTDDETAACRRS